MDTTVAWICFESDFDDDDDIHIHTQSTKTCGTCKRNWNTSTWTRLCPVCDGLPLATMMMTVYEYACAANDDDDLSNGEIILDREDGKS